MASIIGKTIGKIFTFLGWDGSDFRPVKVNSDGKLEMGDMTILLALHAFSHENGGEDEISVEGLSGDLADDQDAKAHSASHQNGGADEISVEGLSGDLADEQDAKAHKASHEASGSDEIDLANLAGATAGIEFIIDGGGSAITTGQKGHLEVPFKCDIERVTLIADQSGDIVVDIWRTNYAGAPPADGNSITSAAPPTLSTAQKAQDSTLTGWSKSCQAGDILAYNVDSVATVQRVLISLKVVKT